MEINLLYFRVKDAKKAYKSMVTYEKGASRFGKDGMDNREPGLGWDECKY